MTKDDLPIIAFETPVEWEKWLAENHTQPSGVWLRIFKKGSNAASVIHAEALDEALCYGWIDGQRNKYDDSSFLQKFTPRRRRSIWSKINIRHVERLSKAGKMKPAGHAEVEAAKADGRRQQACDSHRSMTMPKDFLLEIEKNSKA